MRLNMRGWKSVTPVMVTVLGLFFAAVVGGCGSKGNGAEPEPPTASQRVAEGWAAFERSDLEAARSSFSEAKVLDPSLGAASHGLAWVDLREGALAAAQTSLDRAAALGFAEVDLDAARALVARDLTPVDWARARTAADAVLARTVLYRFSHDLSLDWRDLRLLIAHASFALQDYARVAEQIAALGGVAPAPADPDYVAELLTRLERLGEQVGAPAL